jgi:hypothetical protein
MLNSTLGSSYRIESTSFCIQYIIYLIFPVNKIFITLCRSVQPVFIPAADAVKNGLEINGVF